MLRSGAVVLTTLVLLGCETVSEQREKVQAARKGYQAEANEITLDWTCTGMAYPDFVRIHGNGDSEVADAAYNRMCIGDTIK